MRAGRRRGRKSARRARDELYVELDLDAAERGFDAAKIQEVADEADRGAFFADPARREALRREGERGLALFLPKTWIGETRSSSDEGLTGRRRLLPAGQIRTRARRLHAGGGPSPADRTARSAVRDRRAGRRATHGSRRGIREVTVAGEVVVHAGRYTQARTGAIV